MLVEVVGHGGGDVALAVLGTVERFAAERTSNRHGAAFRVAESGALPDEITIPMRER